MKIETVALESLHISSPGLRRHPPRNRKAIEQSLKRFGQQKPVVVNAQGKILAGSATLNAARALGWSQLCIVRTSLTGHEAQAYAIADNRTAELSQWNDDPLARQLAALQIAASSPADACGFDEHQMQQVIDKATGLDRASPEHPPAVYQVLVTCASESQQRQVYQSLKDEGLPCRVLTL
jgi:hypothetical protein